jgi:hypothetical protein
MIANAANGQKAAFDQSRLAEKRAALFQFWTLAKSRLNDPAVRRLFVVSSVLDIQESLWCRVLEREQAQPRAPALRGGRSA